MSKRGDGPKGPAATRVRKAPRQWTAAIETAFLEALAETANVERSARHAGMAIQTVYRRRRTHPGFAARWREALAEGYGRLELVLLDHALNGVERVETVRDADGVVKQTKTVRTYPHQIAINILRSHRETVERYRALEMARGSRADSEETIVKVMAELRRVRQRLIERRPEVVLGLEEQAGGSGGA